MLFHSAALVEWAQAIVTAIRNELQSEETAPLLAEIEEAIRQQDAEKAAHAEAAANAAALPNVPVKEVPGTSFALLFCVQKVTQGNLEILQEHSKHGPTADLEGLKISTFHLSENLTSDCICCPKQTQLLFKSLQESAAILSCFLANSFWACHAGNIPGLPHFLLLAFEEMDVCSCGGSKGHLGAVHAMPEVA